MHDETSLIFDEFQSFAEQAVSIYETRIKDPNCRTFLANLKENWCDLNEGKLKKVCTCIPVFDNYCF